MKRRVAVLLFAVLAAAGLYGGPARGATVLVVDDDTGGSCEFGDRDVSTIQAAVDAAHPGDLIRVCPGEYAETVIVAKKHLTIEGAKAGVDARWRTGTKGESIVTIDADADPPDPDAAGGLVQLLANGITWDGFLVADNTLGPGISTSPDASGYEIRNTIFNDNGLGLYLHSKGEWRTNVRRNRFHANNEFEQPGAGTGIYSELGARCILIADNLFEEHNEAGILFADTVEKSCIWVERNKSIDDHTFAAFYASTHLHLAANTVRSDRTGYPDLAPGSAIFIGARNKDVVVARNHITATDGNGIDVRDSKGSDALEDAAPQNVDVLKNKIRNAQQNGIDVAASGVKQYVVRGNHSSGNKGVGLLVEKADDAFLANNIARGNKLDCQDLTRGDGTAQDGTANTENTWRNNAGDSDDPDGICRPHRRKADPGHHHGKPRHHKKKHHPHPKRCLPMGVRAI
jgi:nitrous oxidase accessory protein NosD